jgi:ABC-type nitrate/sulfonate/bicarbonate transport system substrate-binding protein
LGASIIAAAAAVSACSSSGSSATSANGKPKITLAWSSLGGPEQTIGYHTIKILQDKYGYEVTAKKLDSTAAHPAFVSGQVDFVESAAQTVSTMVAGGEKMVCFAGNDSRVTYLPVSKYASPGELPKTPIVGVSADSSIDNASWQSMAKGLGTPAESKTVVIGGQSARSSALLSGRIDLAELDAGNALIAVSKSNGKLHILQDYVPYEPKVANDLFCTHKSWADSDAKKQAVTDFAAASIEAARWFRTDPNAWKALVKENNPEFPDAQLDSYHALLVGAGQYPPNGTVVDQASVQGAIDLALSLGNIKSSIPASSFTDPAYEQAALAKLGKADEPSPSASS